MGSSRLPGKTLIPIADRPLLFHILDRVRLSRLVQAVVVATTKLPMDDAIDNCSRQYGVSVYRGSPADVLDRYYCAAQKYGAEVIVRVTADDPFKDPYVMDEVIEAFLRSGTKVDYASNTIKPTYPLGLDIEVIRASALERAWCESTDYFDREHVTPYLWMHPDKFRLLNVEYKDDLSWMRWTLDTQEDLEFAERVYSKLYRGHPFFMDDILTLLRKNPQLHQMCDQRLRKIKTEGISLEGIAEEQR
jgi:spore coat polysaccharide biosynthesis protein SpsF (cytidylyltransferase family)